MPLPKLTIINEMDYWESTMPIVPSLDDLLSVEDQDIPPSLEEMLAVQERAMTPPISLPTTVEETNRWLGLPDLPIIPFPVPPAVPMDETRPFIASTAQGEPELKLPPTPSKEEVDAWIKSVIRKDDEMHTNKASTSATPEKTFAPSLSVTPAKEERVNHAAQTESTAALAAKSMSRLLATTSQLNGDSPVGRRTRSRRPLKQPPLGILNSGRIGKKRSASKKAELARQVRQLGLPRPILTSPAKEAVEKTIHTPSSPGVSVRV